MVGRIPEVLFKVNNLVVFNLHALVFEQFLHRCGRWEVVSPGEFALPIDHPVGRHPKFAKAVVERPAHHSRRAESQDAGNGAVGRHPPVRNAAHHIINLLEIGFLRHCLV